MLLPLYGHVHQVTKGQEPVERRGIEGKPYPGSMWRQLELPAFKEKGSWRGYWGAAPLDGALSRRDISFACCPKKCFTESVRLGQFINARSKNDAANCSRLPIPSPGQLARVEEQRGG